MTLPNPKIIDLSHWNAPSDLNKPAIQDWSKAKEQGVVGAIIRLCSIDNVTGVPYTDWRLDEFVRGAISANIPIGYYWYTRPKWGGGVQVQYILKILKEKNLPLDLDFYIDVEEPGADVNGPGSAPYQARDAIKYMVQQLSSVYPGRVGIYTRQNLWDIYVAKDPLWATLKLWAARWKESLTSPWSDGYNIFRDWIDWKYWQYIADGNGLASTYGFPSGDVDIDLSYYNGTTEEFEAEYNLDPLQDLARRVATLELENSQQFAMLTALREENTELSGKIYPLQAQVDLILENLLTLESWANKTLIFKW